METGEKAIRIFMYCNRRLNFVFARNEQGGWEVGTKE
jgi:hypothetical protein